MYGVRPKKVAIYLAAVVISLILLFIGNRVATADMVGFSSEEDAEVLKVKVVEILDTIEAGASDEDQGYMSDTGSVIFSAKVLNGERRGDTITVSQSIDPFLVYQMEEVEVGDKLIVYQNAVPDPEHEWIAGEYIRSDAMLVLGVIFAVLLFLFGRTKGINTLISLAITCAAIFAVFVPSVLSGMNIYIWSIMTCMFIIASTILIVYGLDRKSVAAAVGCLGGTLLAGILTVIVSGAVELTGLVNDESIYLLYINTTDPIDLKAIVFAAIIIGALGAMMDVSVSIASALMELVESVPDISPKQLVKSGMVIGRDMMGTMTNTLILAYIGSSLSVVLLLAAYNSSMLDLINREMIIIEIMQALIGSFGLLLTIPLTTFICVWLYKNNTTQKKRSEKPWR